ncbi:MAG: DEAD/DEAH box helicase family protein [Lentisphaeria bacterium]|nr:DEAD/DEAH box helicase family protein [Lentisphaeria bacterium]
MSKQIVKFKLVNDDRIKLQANDPKIILRTIGAFTVNNPLYKIVKYEKPTVSLFHEDKTFRSGHIIDVFGELKLRYPGIQIDMSEVQALIRPFLYKYVDLVQPENAKFKYHDYQEDTLKKALRFGRGIIDHTAGSGKSLIIYGLIINYWKAIGSEERVLVYVTNSILVGQVYKDLVEYGCDPKKVCAYGVDFDRKINPEAKIIITSKPFLEVKEKKRDKDNVPIRTVKRLDRNTRKIIDMVLPKIDGRYAELYEGLYVHNFKTIDTKDQKSRIRKDRYYIYVDEHGNKIGNFDEDKKKIKKGSHQFVKNSYPNATKISGISMVIVDEVHSLGSKTSGYKRLNDIYDLVRNHKIFGLTESMPSEVLEKWDIIGICGRVIAKEKAKDLQGKGILTTTRFASIRFNHQVPQPEATSKIKNQSAGKTTQYSLECKYVENCVWTNNMMIEIMYKFKNNTLLLFDHTAHGQILFENLEKINTDDKIILYVDGSTPTKKRIEMFKIMEENSNCFMVANSKCLGSGVNIKNIFTVALAFHSGKKASKIIQAIGRAIGVLEDKPHMTVVDFYHNYKYSMKHLYCSHLRRS